MKLALFSIFATAVGAKISVDLDEDLFWSRELQTSFPPTTPPTAPTPPTPTPPVATDSPTGAPTDSPTSAPTAEPPCGIPVAERKSQTLSILSGVSDAALLTTPGTPQYTALEWLLEYDEFEACPDTNACTLTQRYVMALFYYSTEGDSWTTCSASDTTCPNTPFLSPVDECEWIGLTCNPAKCMTEIVFEDNNVAGSMPSELSSLSQLEVLSLEQGSLTSSIPASLGVLSKLRILDLDFNEISGIIPESVYGLTKLEQLDLNSNEITGTLSTEVGNLEVLRLLQLYENEMTGTVPTELGLLNSLVIAEFFNNTFTGTMPEQVCANTVPPGGSGSISGLTSDCFPNPTAQIECSCCTGCAVF